MTFKLHDHYVDGFVSLCACIQVLKLWLYLHEGSLWSWWQSWSNLWELYDKSAVAECVCRTHLPIICEGTGNYCDLKRFHFCMFRWHPKKNNSVNVCMCIQTVTSVHTWTRHQQFSSPLSPPPPTSHLGPAISLNIMLRCFLISYLYILHRTHTRWQKGDRRGRRELKDDLWSLIVNLGPSWFYQSWNDDFHVFICYKPFSLICW